MTAVLEAQEVTRSFSGIVALDQVCLRVDAGERVGLIGPNGAGKTTFFNCVLGVLPMDRGRVLLEGQDVSGLSVHRRAARGMGRTFQRIELFVESTVREHLLFAERTRRGDGALWKDLLGLGRPKADEIAACDEVLELLGLGGMGDEPVEQLSLGQARLVEVGRALMTRPRLLLLDEPSSGLDRQETADLAATLRTAQDEQGFSILLVEHDVELVRAFTERCYVLDFGTLLTDGPTGEVLDSDVVREAYLGDGAGPRPPEDRVPPDDVVGREVAVDLTEGGGVDPVRVAARPRSPRPGGPLDGVPLLELDRVSASYGPFNALFDVSLRVERGEAVALLGANGVGKTTVARTASGLVAPTEGRVRVAGVDLTGAPTHRFVRAGVAHAPEGRSVLATLSVEDNLRLSFRQMMGRRAVPDALARAYERFPSLARRRALLAGSLSGGEQRMLSLAQVMVEAPDVLIADELSLGLAPIIVDELYRQLERLRSEGTALLIVEQQIGHALDLCDRVVLLDHGSVTWEGPAADAGDRVVREVFHHGAVT